MHKIDRQEMNAKKHAGKKISLIMDKTTVDFFFIASSIYHCFFFLDTSVVM